MIYDASVGGNTKIDAISPLIGNALTLGSGGSAMIDTVGQGWIIGNININDQAIFDR